MPVQEHDSDACMCISQMKQQTIFVGTLLFNISKIGYLQMLYSETLKNVNNHSITSFIHKVMKILYPSKVNYKRHLLCAEKRYFSHLPCNHF